MSGPTVVLVVSGSIAAYKAVLVARLLLEAGAALKAVDGVTLAYRVQQLMDDPVRLGRMSEAARVLGRPRAAAAVVDRVLSPTFVQESASCSVLS